MECRVEREFSLDRILSLLDVVRSHEALPIPSATSHVGIDDSISKFVDNVPMDWTADVVSVSWVQDEARTISSSKSIVLDDVKISSSWRTIQLHN